MPTALEPIELVILGVAYSTPDRTYRVPSCRRRYAAALAARDPKLADYDPKRRELKATDAGVKAFLAARKRIA